MVCFGSSRRRVQDAADSDTEDHEAGVEASETASEAIGMMPSASSTNSSANSDEPTEAAHMSNGFPWLGRRDASKRPTEGFVSGKIDSGCTTTILSSKTLEKLMKSGEAVGSDIASVTSKGSKGSTYKFADGEAKQADDQVDIVTEVNGKPAQIFANVFKGGKTPFLVGLNFLRENNVTITFRKDFDRITCRSLGLSNAKLARERKQGLSILPFNADYFGVVDACEKRFSDQESKSSKSTTG